MQIFIPYEDAFKTAKVLDNKRLNKQIIECKQIVNAALGESTAWRNHPVVLMYKDYTPWVNWYMLVLKNEQAMCKGNTSIADAEYIYNIIRNIEPSRPYFLGLELLHRSHRSRLYVKDNIHYASFADSRMPNNYNFYIVDNVVKAYLDGKCVDYATIHTSAMERLFFYFLIS